MSCGGLQDLGAGALDVQGEAKGNGLIWPGKDKAFGRPHCCVLLKKRLSKIFYRGAQQKDNRQRSRVEAKEILVIHGGKAMNLSTKIVCCERLCSPHLWRF